MKANQIIFQNRLEEMVRSQVQKFQLRPAGEWEKNKETDHKPPDPLKQTSSYYEEFIPSIEKQVIDGDSNHKETEGNHVYTYEIGPSPMPEQMQNGERQVTEVLDTSNFPSKHL